MELQRYFEGFNDRDWEPEAEPDGEPLRLAIVGLGGYARDRALPAIERTARCETTVAVSGSPGKIETVASRFDVDETLDYEAFHAGEAVEAYDAVYISTPPAHHLAAAETAAEHGKHVLCEKPMDVNSDRAERMVEVCDDAGVALMVAYRLHAEPAYRRLRELIGDGFIGDPVQVHGAFSLDLLGRTEGSATDVWRIDPEVAGGGALMDLGIYPLNTARYLLDADPVAAQATTAAPDEAFDGVDEHVAFQVTFPDDAVGSFSASFNAHRDSQLKVVGTEGRVLVDSAFGGLVDREVVVERGEMHAEFTGPYVDEIEEQFEYFGTRVLSGESIEPDGAHGLVDIAVADAVYESAATGARVGLDG